MKKYIIKDWAGNRKFPNKEFATFEDGWEFLDTQLPIIYKDEYIGNEDIISSEYYVVLKDEFTKDQSIKTKTLNDLDLGLDNELILKHLHPKHKLRQEGSKPLL